MNHLSGRVIPVFSVNLLLSLIGFALFISKFGTPENLLHPVLAGVWTVLLFAQMLLANKQSPLHKPVGRIAMAVLFVSVYASMSALAARLGSETPMPFSNTVAFVFVATAIAALIYIALGLSFVIKGNIEAHSTAMLLAGAIAMAAGIARLAGGLDAILGVPFELTYALSVLSMAYVLWRWRPSQSYLVGSYLVLMACVIFLR